MGSPDVKASAVNEPEAQVPGFEFVVGESTGREDLEVERYTLFIRVEEHSAHELACVSLPTRGREHADASDNHAETVVVAEVYDAACVVVYVARPH